MVKFELNDNYTDGFRWNNKKTDDEILGATNRHNPYHADLNIKTLPLVCVKRTTSLVSN